MSLGVVIKGPEGIVLAADSRVTLEAQKKGTQLMIPINYDNATKLLSFSERHDSGERHNFVGCVTYGAAVIGQRTAHSFIPEFQQRVLAESESRLTVEKYATLLSGFFKERWNETVQNYSGPDMTFVVGGYDPDAAYGQVFLFSIPSQPEPKTRHPTEKDFGMTWGGQLEVASRLIRGFDPNVPDILKKTIGLNEEQVKQVYDNLKKNLEFPIPYNILPLQDCVDLAIFLIRTTMTAQRLGIGVRGVGGPIDVAVITRTRGLQYIQQKIITGEGERITKEKSS